MYARYFKRFFDFTLSLLALLVLALPLLVVALAVLVAVGRPVLFRQQRIGKGNRPFTMYKFRSMTEARDSRGVYLPDPERLTPLGRLLRSTSIDELPELLNVLKGDMSLIGPRPLPVRYLERYTPTQLRRHEVRPGLSCPSVVAGRNSSTWEAQFEGDVRYVDQVSLLTDLHCVIQTLRIVVSRKGAVADDGGARGEFIGTARIEDLRHDAEGNFMKL